MIAERRVKQRLMAADAPVAALTEAAIEPVWDQYIGHWPICAELPMAPSPRGSPSETKTPARGRGSVCESSVWLRSRCHKTVNLMERCADIYIFTVVL
jgi:hypothetical protein